MMLKKSSTPSRKKEVEDKPKSNNLRSVCNKVVDPSACVKADGGKTLICRNCFSKLF